MVNKHVLFDGKWIGDVRNDSFKEGQLTAAYIPGIGEVDKTGTEAGLIGIERQSMIESPENFRDKTLYGATDYHKINVATIAPKSQYQYGEIHAIEKYAREVQKAGQVAALCQSLGGYGMAVEVSKDSELPKKFDCIVWMAMGPGVRANTAKHLAESKVPNWFIVCEGDDYAGTHDEVSINLHKEIVRLGGISFLTVFQKGSFKDPHVIFGVLLNQWETFTTKPYSPLNEVVPKMSVYKWIRSQKKGFPVIPPDGVWQARDLIAVQPPIPAPIPTPPVVEPPVEETPPIEPELPAEPTPEIPDDDDIPDGMPPGAIFLSGVWSNPDPQRGGDMVALVWSNNGKLEQQFIRAAKGEQIVSVYSRLLVRTGDKMQRTTLTFEKDGVKTPVTYGPYKK